MVCSQIVVGNHQDYRKLSTVGLHRHCLFDYFQIWDWYKHLTMV